MNTKDIYPSISFAAINSEFIKDVNVNTHQLTSFMRTLGISDAEILDTSIHFLPNVEQEFPGYDHATKTVYGTTDMNGDFTNTSTRITLATSEVKQSVDNTLSEMLTKSLAFGLNSRAKYLQYDADVAKAKRQNRIKKPLSALGAAAGSLALAAGVGMEIPNVYAASGVSASISCAGAALATALALYNKPSFWLSTPEFPVGGKVIFPETNFVTVSSRRLYM